MRYFLFLLLPLLILTAELRAEEREIALKCDFGTLRGTLRTPDGGSDIAALIIAGSGPTDRNCNSPQFGMYPNTYAYLAQALEKQGIASLRYDKRAIAASPFDDPKQLDSISFDDYVDDARALALWLRDEGFKKVVLVGHSEGALIALCVAAQDAGQNVSQDTGQNAAQNAAHVAVQNAGAGITTDGKATSGEHAAVGGEPTLEKLRAADAVVSLAGMGFPIDHVLLRQLSAQLSPGLLIQAGTILNSLRQGKTVENYPRELAPLFLPYLQRFWISVMKYDPQELIRKVEVPVLIVNGDNDIQILVDDAEALKKAQPAAELLIIPGMTHTLKQSEGRDIQGQMAAYMNGELPLDTTLAEAVPRFILGYASARP